MSNRTKFAMLATGAILVLVMALGVTAVFAQSDGDDPVPEETTPVPETESEQPQNPGRRGMHGLFGLPEGLSSKDELLANALNVDVETLEAARETARAAAIEQALDEGLITQEQADMLLEGSFGFGFHHGRGFHGFGRSIDGEALLADALNISVEELQAAKQEAREAAIAELIDAGYLTQEEADLMAAREALKDAIDRDALLAQVLGVSEAELEEAKASRAAVAALIENSGLTAAELAQAMQDAYDAAAQQAVDDGVISAEQLEALQNAGFDTLRGFGGPGFGGHGHGGRGRHGGFGPFGGSTQPSTTTEPVGLSI